MVFTVLMKSPQLRKASFEVRFKHNNSHHFWEWIIVNSKTNFCRLKELHAHCFLKRELFSIFSFHFELQKVWLNRDRTAKQSGKLWNLAAKLDVNFQPKWNFTLHVKEARPELRARVVEPLLSDVIERGQWHKDYVYVCRGKMFLSPRRLVMA